MSKDTLKIQNKSYNTKLLEVVKDYRASNRTIKPNTEFLAYSDTYKGWLHNNSPYISLPTKCIELLQYCNNLERSFFIELLLNHMMLSYSKNGLIELSYNTTCERLTCGKTKVSNGIKKLADLGLIRVSRSAKNANIGNLFLLTFLPDCLGQMPVADYKHVSPPKIDSKKYKNYNDRQSAALRHRIHVRSILEEDTSKCVRDLKRVGDLHTKRVAKQSPNKRKCGEK